jgi:hypothetical protein
MGFAQVIELAASSKKKPRVTHRTAVVHGNELVAGGLECWRERRDLAKSELSGTSTYLVIFNDRESQLIKL